MLLHGAPKLDENGKPVRDGRSKIIYEPYRIKVLNTINFSKSMKYNPLAYVRSEKDMVTSRTRMIQSIGSWMTRQPRLCAAFTA